MRFFRLNQDQMIVGWGINHVKHHHLAGYELTLSIPLWIFPKKEYFDDFKVIKGRRALRLLFYLAVSGDTPGWHFEIMLRRVPIGKRQDLIDFYHLLHKRIATLGDLLSCYKDEKFIEDCDIASWVIKHYNKQEQRAA